MTETDSYCQVQVAFDDQQLWVDWPDRPRDSIRWDELIGVAVATNDQGPFTEDVYWHLASPHTLITYPSQATGVSRLLVRLQQLPDFNNEALIEAMSCTDNKTFILWDHQGRQQTS